MSRDASLHEKTVQRVAELEQPRRRRVTTSTRRTINSYTVKVDERVMATARRIANGDMTRIKIVNAEEVIVR
jgi:hypothetical protein